MQFVDNKVTFKQPKTVKSRRLIALPPSNVAVLQEHWEAQKKNEAVLRPTACYG